VSHVSYELGSISLPMNMIAIKEKDSDYELIENKEKKETLYSKCI